MGKKFDADGLAVAVKRKRKAEGVSLTDLGEALGLSAPTLSRVERGQGMPNPEAYCAILRWLGMPTSRFIPGLAPSPTHIDAASAIDMLPALIRADRNLAADHAEFLVGLLGDVYRRATRAALGDGNAGKMESRPVSGAARGISGSVAAPEVDA